jgi:xanthine dehydrogenase accessory factor
MNRETLERVNAARRSKAAVVLATDLATGAEELLAAPDYASRVFGAEIAAAAKAAAHADRSGPFAHGNAQIFLNVFNPPLRMIVVGAVHIAQALARMAAIADYDVAIVDPRRSFATEERFPGVALRHDWPDEAMAELRPDRRTAVVTLTHDPKIDDPALVAALRSEAFYIGALGSKKTHASRLARLAAHGFDERALARIRGPVGLALGAKSPAEIAISIVAQITAALRGAAP